ncbi:PTS mannitol transporter subunit IICB [Demequina sp. TTPB684]|uniref:PTS mannitol transporter subunit IICB n=1 Tax=unclassified Demequina TaxID=2620311 RepID=UPI001CF3430E|nr:MULTISPECIES: PTS mannitol transporter subunit IICB [unclassified Demequina]MCB2413544.1 PTS mannitol transporter subunit IICB [Demequina sp. TTPB684]UPU87236.1 PTS mannitol transporter subunit IICB [Demequina sp. TMPB413]
MSAPDMQANKNREGGGAAAQVQRLGRFMSAMIMPNIGAFVAWGLITALFIEAGWINKVAEQFNGEPHDGVMEWTASIAVIVGPMITYLLPLLIGYMGGKLVYGTRGAVIGAVATTGVIVGSDVPMFLGAMIIGPAAAWCLMKVEGLWQDKVKPGFEMLVDNFSLGILGGFIAILGKIIIGPVVERGVEWAGEGVDFLVENNLLPLASIVVEPAKVLFLNNAINHGVFTPLGTAEAEDAGKSLLFMIESNPGPGLGILVAFAFFGPRMLKAAAPGAIIIHFFGGIHEIYFPFVLAKPKMIAAAILGGMTGVLVGVLFNGGLVAPPSPGSIFAWAAFTPPGVGNWVVMLLQVTLAAAVAFTVAAFLLGFGREAKREDGAEDSANETASVPA